MRQSIELTPAQLKAFQSLKRALKKCADQGIYLWDNYGTISAVNGDRVSIIGPDLSLGHPLPESEVSEITTSCWRNSNADDPLYYSEF